jgi:endonuclease/exonuclease/phosphatase (EEP) superfamily protein YafD
VPDEPPADLGDALAVVTWNVNFGLVGTDDDATTLADLAPDIVLLQETTPAWERWAERELKELLPHQEFWHHPAAGGLAILSRFPVSPDAVMPSPVGWFPGWRVVVHTPHGPVQTLNVHLHPPVSDDGSWVKGYFTTGSQRRDELLRFAETLDPALPTVVAGDFNEPSGPATAVLRDAGFHCALDEMAPGSATWRWPTPLGDLNGNLDHIYYDPALEPLDAWVVPAGRSDHFPVVALFQTPSD